MRHLHRDKTEKINGTDGIRKRILKQFETQLSAVGFSALRLTRIATDCRVSRQTIHKDFGDKYGLAQALAIRVLDGFVDKCIDEMRRHGSVYYAIYHSAMRTLRMAENNVVISSALRKPDDTVVRMMTINIEPILKHCRARLAKAAVEHWPDLDPHDIETAAHVIVSVFHEQVLCRSGSVEDVALRLAWVIGGFAETSRRTPASVKARQKAHLLSPRGTRSHLATDQDLESRQGMPPPFAGTARTGLVLAVSDSETEPPANRAKLRARRADLKSRILDTFDRLLAESGYAKLRMALVAERAHVSTQAIRYHFGGKRQTARASVARAFDRLFEDIETCLCATHSPYEAVHNAMIRALRSAEQNPVIAYAIKSTADDGSTDPMPILISTEATELIQRGRDRVKRALLARWPELDDSGAERAADILVGSFHSKVLCAPLSVEDSARNISEVIGTFIDSRRPVAERLDARNGHDESIL